jgi:thioredoxin 1
MASQVVEATDANMQEEVFKADKPVLLDFWATWCGPCRATKPMIEKIAEEMKGKIKVVTIDVDKNPKGANQFNVMSIPTMFIVKDGQIKAQIVGAPSEETLRKKITETIK